MRDTARAEPAGTPPKARRPGRFGRARRSASRRTRLARYGFGILGLTLFVGSAWLAGTAVLARSQLLQAKGYLGQLQSDIDHQDFSAAKPDAARLASHTKRAHQLTSGPAWWVAAKLPIPGSPINTVKVAAAEVNRLATTALPTVIDVAAGLNPHALRTQTGINLAALQTAAPAVHEAAVAAALAQSRLVALPTSSWVPAVDKARQDLVAQLQPITQTLAGVDRAAQLLPPMLGGQGSRRYFVAFENESEARGLGGLPGAFAILTANRGTVKFSYFGNDSALDDVAASVQLAADYTDKWRQAAPAKAYINSDIGTSMSDAAQIWASMWQTKTGQRVDGAIAVDPTALSYLLQVSGPATLDSGEHVSSTTVVSLTEQQVYARFTDNTARKQYLLSVAKAVDERLLTSGDSLGLVRAALVAAGENRLRVYSLHPAEQATLQRTTFSAVPGSSGHAVAGFVVVNAAGSKLDYYLERDMTYRRQSCPSGSGGSAGLATVSASIKLMNLAPASGLPAYVTTRLDAAGAAAKPAANRLMVTYYGTAGAQAQSVLLNGRPVPSVVGTENGLLAVTVDIELPAGVSQKVAITATEPKSGQPVDFIRQPLVQPMALTATGQEAGAGCR